MVLDDMLDAINIVQLEMLGVRKEFLYISLVICGVILLVIISYILVRVCLRYQWNYVIMYVITSLTTLFLIWFPAIPISVDITIEGTLKTIAIIGWCLAFYLFISKEVT